MLRNYIVYDLVKYAPSMLNAGQFNFKMQRFLRDFEALLTV